MKRKGKLGELIFLLTLYAVVLPLEWRMAKHRLKIARKDLSRNGCMGGEG